MSDEATVDARPIAPSGNQVIRVRRNGEPVLVDGFAAETGGGGNIDMTESGGSLYVQNPLTGNVQGYAVNDDGSLELITTVDDLPVFANGIGMEGIAGS